MSAADLISIVILVIIIFVAVKYSIPHFKGEGACCGGGGSKRKAVKPKKLDKVLSVKTVKIDGMTCKNCVARVQNALNSVDGISAKVSLGSKSANVKLGRDISDSEISDIISDLGYTVTEIKNRNT